MSLKLSLVLAILLMYVEMTYEFCVSFSEGGASAVHDVWMGP